VANSTNEMNAYVDGMMKLSQINQMKLVKKEINSHQLVQEIILENKNEYLNREINWKIDDDLPEIYGDPTLLRMAFTNVILNSIKFTDKQKELVIEIGLDKKQSDESSKVLYIKDNGIGFDMKYASKLFTVFQRLHLSRDYPGTGIGLATVQRIIHRHNGKVWADSKEKHGTTIYFKLPTKE
jgi:light-regulated signal transduction histidine kinase (bacteriophytochrome)